MRGRLVREIFWKLVYFLVFVPVAMAYRAARPPLEQGWQLEVASYFSPPDTVVRHTGQLR